jgi:hypothetical protein
MPNALSSAEADVREWTKSGGVQRIAQLAGTTLQHGVARPSFPIELRIARLAGAYQPRGRSTGTARSRCTTFRGLVGLITGRRSALRTARAGCRHPR